MQKKILTNLRPEELSQAKRPGPLHRRTISKTSEDLLLELKISSPQINQKQTLITPQAIIDQLSKKGVKPIFSQDQSFESLSDEEANIRNIIDLRKVLSPAYTVEGQVKATVKNDLANLGFRAKQEIEKALINTSTTAISISDESNIDKILFLLEEKFLSGKHISKLRKNIEELLQKSSEPHFTLLLDENLSLRGIFYVEIATGYFHRIMGYDNIPMIIAPRKVKQFLCYDSSEKDFFSTIPPKFDAIIIVN